MSLHDGMLASVQPMEDGAASHADMASHHASHADVAFHHASGAGTGAAASIADARAADGSASAAPSASYASGAAAASCVDAWAADASPAAAIPAYEKAHQNSAQVLSREATCVAAQSSQEAAEGVDATAPVFEQLSPSPSPVTLCHGQPFQHRVHLNISTPLLSLDARHSRGPGTQREKAGRQETGVSEAGRQREIAALVEENKRLEAERARAEEGRARAEERSARMGEELCALQGNLQEAQALCWQRQAQLEEALSEVAAGRRERGALEEELLRLQCALDQCMLRLNSDSAYMVDRRIVVKLLVAYFQRNRSREVLDIMCRILECSKDERQQLELAASHPALTRSASFKSKGSVRQGSSKGSKGGVFGLPGRIAGGFLGSNRSVSENMGEPGRDSHGQHEAERKPEARKAGSLTDLWVDFLVTETDDERELRQGQQQHQQQQLQQQESGNLRASRSSPPDSNSSTDSRSCNEGSRPPQHPTYTTRQSLPPRSPSHQQQHMYQQQQARHTRSPSYPPRSPPYPPRSPSYPPRSPRCSSPGFSPRSPASPSRVPGHAALFFSPGSPPLRFSSLSPRSPYSTNLSVSSSPVS
ncbi:unnamed protein product [Closterium sp. NIES-54]